MFDVVGPTFRRSVGAFALFVAGSLLLGGTAAAQTIVLNQQGQVTDTTIRGGAYANTNYDGDPLITRRSDADQDWARRALLKFDTENTIPEGAQITSATLTLTVKAGLGSAGQTRPLQVFRVPNGWLENEATWIRRMGSSNWATAGGDTSGQFASAYAGNTAGSKVTVNVTSLVQRTVNGEFDTRYTRIMLADAGADAKESYREFYRKSVV